MPCFALNWDQSQLQQSQDFGTDLIRMVLLNIVLWNAKASGGDKLTKTNFHLNMEGPVLVPNSF